MVAMFSTGRNWARSLWRSAAWIVLLIPARAIAADAPLWTQAEAALARATTYIRSISKEGGYLWTYSADLSQRAGERPATPSQIWVQPPGTPAMGMVFLRIYEATHDRQYLEAARDAATALARGQLESGGWDYVIEFAPALSTHWYHRTDRGKISAAEALKRFNVSTYDDDNTQSALRLLLAVADVTANSTDPRDIEIREARDYALAKLLAAQRPNGGWPQRWDGTPVDPKNYPAVKATIPAKYPREQPAGHVYLGFYTLNDNTQRDCVMTLLDAAKRLKRPDFRAAALRGGDFLVEAQLPEPQPVWAQQYNLQMEPAWARAFEPPTACSNESGGAMRLLLELYLETGDEKYFEPLPRAVAWFKRSSIAPNTWARLYELGTNRPVFGDRDGRFHYTFEELTPERQTGYSWRGNYGIPELMARVEQLQRAGRGAIVKQRQALENPSARQKTAAARGMQDEVRRVIAALDAQGRWLTQDRTGESIRMATFIANADALVAYLRATK